MAAATCHSSIRQCCCIVLQCVAVCCVCCSGHLSFVNPAMLLHCVAVCCSVLQCVAVCCVCCSGHLLFVNPSMLLHCVAVCCSVLQCVACVAAATCHSSIKESTVSVVNPKVYRVIFFLYINPTPKGIFTRTYLKQILTLIQKLRQRWTRTIGRRAGKGLVRGGLGWVGSVRV